MRILAALMLALALVCAIGPSGARRLRRLDEAVGAPHRPGVAPLVVLAFAACCTGAAVVMDGRSLDGMGWEHYGVSA